MRRWGCVASASEESKFDDGTDVSEECIPVKIGVLKGLDAEEAYELLVHASSKYNEQISTAPPVQPKGGTVFLYNLGEDSDKWDLQKKKLR